MELVNSSRRAETAAGLAGTSPRREKIPAGPDVEKAVRTAAGRDRRVRRRRRSLWCSASRAGRRSRCRWRRSMSRRRACASAEPRGSVDPLPDRETVSWESKTTTWASQSSSWSWVRLPQRRISARCHSLAPVTKVTHHVAPISLVSTGPASRFLMAREATSVPRTTGRIGYPSPVCRSVWTKVRNSSRSSSEANTSRAMSSRDSTGCTPCVGPAPRSRRRGWTGRRRVFVCAVGRHDRLLLRSGPSPASFSVEQVLRPDADDTRTWMAHGQRNRSSGGFSSADCESVGPVTEYSSDG